jgi:hypothetical protein
MFPLHECAPRTRLDPPPGRQGDRRLRHDPCGRPHPGRAVRRQGLADAALAAAGPGPARAGPVRGRRGDHRPRDRGLRAGPPARLPGCAWDSPFLRLRAHRRTCGQAHGQGFLLRLLLAHEARADLPHRARTRLQRDRPGPASRRPGRELPDERLPWRAAAYDEGPLPHRRGRPARDPSASLRARAPDPRLRRGGGTAGDPGQLPRLFLQAHAAGTHEGTAGARGGPASAPVPEPAHHPRAADARGRGAGRGAVAS